jgi:tetratricopeptide (TPR) repeat protein
LLTLLARDIHFRHQAPEAFTKALQQFPGNVYIEHLCATFLLECGQNDAAESLLVRLAEQQPGNGSIARTQGLVLMQRGARDAAARCFKRGMVDKDAESALLCHEELAKLALLEGRPEVALDLFRHGAARYTPSSRFLREWGLLERKLGNVDEARGLFQQSVQGAAMDIRSWVAWALLERTCQDHSKALDVLRQVRLPDPEREVARCACGVRTCCTRDAAMQALTVAPKVTTLWYLYCETALKTLPVSTCRRIFQEAHRCVPRCALNCS